MGTAAIADPAAEGEWEETKKRKEKKRTKKNKKDKKKKLHDGKEEEKVMRRGDDGSVEERNGAAGASTGIIDESRREKKDKKRKKRKREKREVEEAASSGGDGGDNDEGTDAVVSKQDVAGGGPADGRVDKDKTKKKKKKKKRRREDCDANAVLNGEKPATESASVELSAEEAASTEKKKHKKRKRSRAEEETPENKDAPTALSLAPPLRSGTSTEDCSAVLPIDCRYVLAPMVGASELAFRLLCRKYGASVAYTPMMSSTSFARDESYRRTEFQTIPEDRPLVCHFSANDPADFAAAAKLVEHKCDAVDLNLGCPQRTAYVGHFGSYLLGPDDRRLVLDIVRAGRRAVSIPIFVKIRLLDTLSDTIDLCRQLRDAGASLIAIHARYRASFERKGPGARDGPALLDQVREVKKVVSDIPIVSNGNVITYDDVVTNRDFTNADGIMSAEGILDNPALFLPRFGTRTDGDSGSLVEVADPSPLPQQQQEGGGSVTSNDGSGGGPSGSKRRRKLEKKLREIKRIEAKGTASGGEDGINDEQKAKLRTKQMVLEELDAIKRVEAESEKKTRKPNEDERENEPTAASGPSVAKTKRVPLRELYRNADDKLRLANEYLELVRQYPVKIRSVIFHIRRILKSLLNQFQLMEECVACSSLDEVQNVVRKCAAYREDPATFRFDREKAAREKEALERRRREEGKRKAYEARMVRKAKREGRSDMEYYLRQGAEVPTVETVKKLQSLARDAQLAAWKENHAQHCISYHLDPGGCKRDRTCAFLHVEAKGANTFVETDEVAG